VEESIESPEAMRLPPPRRLLPRRWQPPSSSSGGIGLELSSDPLAPPLLLLIDRSDPAVVAALPRLTGLLAPLERARLAQLRSAEDRERFLLGRTVLRLCLGELLDRSPASLVLAPGPWGKPFLADGEGLHPQGAPCFNISHSGQLVLLGFHAVGAVGVDVERHRPDLRWRPIALRHLPSQEVSRIESLSPAAQGMAFLQAWCRLEAGLKARGVGLYGLERLEEGHKHLEVGIGGIGRIWQVALPEDYAGAAALA
jgi:4'-phosphopantetheinyl transferase